MVWVWLVVLVVVAVGLIPAAVTLTLYLLWFYDRRNFPQFADDHAVTEPLTAGRVAVAMLREALSLSLLTATVPLRLLYDASPERCRRRGERPVILVHGYGGNSANFLWLQWRLRRWGFANVYAVSYTPPTVNCRKLAVQVERHVERILRRTGADKADLVCHSMGGPLSRYALKELGLAGRVGRLVTLGSPHRGSRIAALFPARGAAAQIRYRSPFVTELAEGGECPVGVSCYCLFSSLDNFILPAGSATLEGAALNRHLPYLGHASLLYSGRAARVVADCLRAE